MSEALGSASSPAPDDAGFQPGDGSAPRRSAKIPPHSIEAEQAVLGGLLLNDQAYYQVAEILVENDFYRRDHRLIYHAIARLCEDAERVDVVTLAGVLEGLEQLERVGGRAYLMELAEHTPGVSNVAAYARIVRERAILRQLIAAANNIAEGAFNPQGRDATELLDLAEREVFEIAQARPREGGPVGVKDLLVQALDRIDHLYHSKNAVTGLSTGFHDLDGYTSGLQPSDLIIVAGRPSMGKTSFAMNMVEHALMLDEAAGVLVFSMEMPADALAMRMLSSLGRISQSHMRTGQLSDDDWPRLTSTINLLRDRPLFIDDTAALSPTELRSRARRVAREHGTLGLIVVDYLQLMQVPGHSENRAGEISEISRALKGLAKEMNCPVIAISQLNRSLEQRPNKRPQMADLRESGAIEQDADLILFVYRDEVYNEDSADKGIAEIIIGKQRNGPIGTVRVAFLGHLTKFESLAPERYEGLG